MHDRGDFEVLKLGANVATLAIGVVSALTYYVCWRWSEAARVRRMAKRGRAGFSSLPSPVPLLPRWLGLIGGHTLQIKMNKVISRLRFSSLPSPVPVLPYGWGSLAATPFKLTTR